MEENIHTTLTLDGNTLPAFLVTSSTAALLAKSEGMRIDFRSKMILIHNVKSTLVIEEKRDGFDTGNERDIEIFNIGLVEVDIEAVTLTD